MEDCLNGRLSEFGRSIPGRMYKTPEEPLVKFSWRSEAHLDHGVGALLLTSGINYALQEFDIVKHVDTGRHETSEMIGDLLAQVAHERYI